MSLLTLYVREPSLGWTDRSDYLWRGESAPQIGFTINQGGQRGPCTIPFVIPADDPYIPTVRSQVRLLAGTDQVYFGIIADFDLEWLSNNGDRHYTLNLVTLDAICDTYRIPPRVYTHEYAGNIVLDLFSQIDGLPFSIGTVSQGALLDSVVLDYDVLNDVVQQLATESGFVRGLDPTTNPPTFYFQEPTTVTSPIEISPSGANRLFDSTKYSERSAEYRNRQIAKLSFGAFSPSDELFAGDDNTTLFTLRSPIDHVVKATLTTNTRATATGIYTGQPSPGDTISVNNLVYRFVTALDNTEFGQVLIGENADQTYGHFRHAINATMDDFTTSPATRYATAIYSLPTWENSLCNIDGIDTANNQFTIYVKVPGEGGNNLPLSEDCANFSWHGGSQDAPGVPPDPLPDASPTDPVAFSQVIFRRLPFDGDAFTVGGQTYTWKAILTGTPNQILIDTSLATRNMVNLVDAVNGNPLTLGTTYSTGTAANSLVRIGTIRPFGGSVAFGTIFFNSAVYADVLALGPSPGTPTPVYPSITDPFSFLAITPTAAGTDDISSVPSTTTQASAGAGATPDPEAVIEWSSGYADIVCKTAPKSGQSLNVSYYRLGANIIAAENTPDVALRASLEASTGRYDQAIDDTNDADALLGLAKVQAALRIFGEFVKSYEFATYTPGLLPGQLVNVDVLRPTYAPELINTTTSPHPTWLIQEVAAAYIVGEGFRYRVTLVSTTQIQTDTQFMERLAQVGGDTLGASSMQLARQQSGGGDGSGGGFVLIEETPVGVKNKINTRFTLSHVPKSFRDPLHQFVRFTLNEGKLEPLSFASPPVPGSFTIDKNILTMSEPPNEDDVLLAWYIPDTLSIAHGELLSVTVFATTRYTEETGYTGWPQVRYSDGVHSDTFVDLSTPAYSTRTDSAVITGVSAANLRNAIVTFRVGGSLSCDFPEGSGAWLYITDCYILARYANLNPALSPVDVYMYPTAYHIDDGESGIGLPVDAVSVSGPPAATINSWHVSGLSTPSLLTFSNFA